jgi:hypothetical protein
MYRCATAANYFPAAKKSPESQLPSRAKISNVASPWPVSKLPLMAKTDRTTRRKSSLSKLIEKYYADLADLARQNVFVEMGTCTAFFALLHAAGREHGWTLIAEQEKKVGGKTIREGGTFKDEMYLVRGYWEAKDTADKLDVEIEKKRKAGYPLNNIIFEDTATAVFKVVLPGPWQDSGGRESLGAQRSIAELGFYAALASEGPRWPTFADVSGSFRATRSSWPTRWGSSIRRRKLSISCARDVRSKVATSARPSW